MDAEKATSDNVDGFEIARMARLLGVSRSGYYDWARRQAAGPSPAQQRRADLTSKIITFHAESDRVYGSPRILADLREAGEQVSAKTVATLMRRAGVVGISPRRFVPVTTQAGPDPQPVPDLVGRRFDQGQLNVVWTSDITYLATGEGWLYLCAVRDGYSRRVLGWAVEDHLRTDLVEAALRRAVTLRGKLPGKVIFHADRGSQGNTPPSRSPTSAPTWTCCVRWAGPACAGTTPPRNRSGRR
jgi:putative transposase